MKGSLWLPAGNGSEKGQKGHHEEFGSVCNNTKSGWLRLGQKSRAWGNGVTRYIQRAHAEPLPGVRCPEMEDVRGWGALRPERHWQSQEEASLGGNCSVPQQR